MTGLAHRRLSFLWFVVALVGTTVFYVVILRQFGALPEVLRNADRLSHLETEIDSMRTEIRHGQP